MAKPHLVLLVPCRVNGRIDTKLEPTRIPDNASEREALRRRAAALGGGETSKV